MEGQRHIDKEDDVDFSKSIYRGLVNLDTIRTKSQLQKFERLKKVGRQTTLAVAMTLQPSSLRDPSPGTAKRSKLRQQSHIVSN